MAHNVSAFQKKQYLFQKSFMWWAKACRPQNAVMDDEAMSSDDEFWNKIESHVPGVRE